jgi:uncharacterized DUF497 family protein
MTIWKWDSQKDLANQRKHRLSFAKARQIFDDGLLLSRLDAETTEERWQSIGVSEGVVVVVVHTWRETATGEAEIRIISARKATKHERKAYREDNF